MSDQATCRYFLSYSGIKLPLNLVNPLTADETQNRNTYFCGYYDADERLIGCQKLVYGEVETEHRYSYHDNGAISQADIIQDDETNTLLFDEQGAPL
jgi:hypothetical protein